MITQHWFIFIGNLYYIEIPFMINLRIQDTNEAVDGRNYQIV